MSARDRFWAEFYSIKFEEHYYELYLRRAEFIQNGIEMFLAVTTSSSISGWIIWREYSFIWAAIIAASQVINAIMPKLPYKDRIKALTSFLVEYEILLLDVEKVWLDIQDKSLGDSEINKSFSQVRKRRSESQRKYLISRSPDKDERLRSKAKTETDLYFHLYYSAEDRPTHDTEKTETE